MSEIIHKGELKIKTCSKKKEKSDDEAIKKEYNKAMDTKKKIEEILDEVDKFQKKYKK